MSKSTAGSNTEYYVVDSLTIGEKRTVGTTVYNIAYLFDENANVIGINVNGTEYYFVKNLQGDVCERRRWRKKRAKRSGSGGSMRHCSAGDAFAATGDVISKLT